MRKTSHVSLKRIFGLREVQQKFWTSVVPVKLNLWRKFPDYIFNVPITNVFKGKCPFKNCTWDYKHGAAWSPQASPRTHPSLFHSFSESKLWFRKRRIVQGQRQGLSHAGSVERVGVSLSNRGGKNNWYSHGRTEPTSVLCDSAAAALHTNSSKTGGVFPEEIWQFLTAQNISAASLTCQGKWLHYRREFEKTQGLFVTSVCHADYKFSTT